MRSELFGQEYLEAPVGRGSGEAFHHAFAGSGFLIVQPRGEPPRMAAQQGGRRQAAGGMLGKLGG